MKYYKVSVNQKNLLYYLNNEPDKLVFENYSRQDLILIAYAILSEYKKLNFYKKYLDNFR